ncbi:Zinc finger protein CONSTANS-LIKE 4 [Linum grandiflorum]
MASKLCDSCKSATASLFCRPDSAFLCVSCDSKIHAANKLASRHPRVLVCEVCEQAPAHVTCKADAAALCVSCDRDIHSANPLARRHERVPIVPFYDSVSSGAPAADVKSSNSTAAADAVAVNFLGDRYLIDGDDDVSREEAEAASWLLPNPGSNKAMAESSDPELNTGQFLFGEMDPYLDLDYGTVDPKIEAQEQNSSGSDGVVPAPVMNDHCFEFDFSTDGSKAFAAYGYSTQCLSHSVSSSSIDVGVVPDGCAMTEISNSAASQAVPLSAADREARVMRYREKRKNRKFEKTIRYASRKAYAETRPRIKGRFAKRKDMEVEADRSMYGFGVVPSF